MVDSWARLKSVHTGISLCFVHYSKTTFQSYQKGWNCQSGKRTGDFPHKRIMTYFVVIAYFSSTFMCVQLIWPNVKASWLRLCFISRNYYPRSAHMFVCVFRHKFWCLLKVVWCWITLVPLLLFYYGSIYSIYLYFYSPLTEIYFYFLVRVGVNSEQVSKRTSSCKKKTLR